MSVRVNLLPEATKQKDRAAQQRSLVGLAAVLLLAVLGGIYAWAAMQVNDAEELLATEEARTAELRGEQAELVGFQELADRRDRATQTLITAMGSEVSLAALLQDVAAVMPGDAQIESLAINLPPEPNPEAPGVGTLNMTGKTLTSHAPGVERVLLSLDKIVSFRDLYLNSSTLDDPESTVATFSLDGQVGIETRTERYAEGLPEELR
jgi:Tfp pilus assembly protein PilN